MSHNLTALVEIEAPRNTPKDPFSFGRSIENNQDVDRRMGVTQNVLFNKGRYFECTVHPQEVREEVSQLIGVPIEYGTMINGPWNKLEDFVVAMNALGRYVKIEIDWI